MNKANATNNSIVFWQETKDEDMPISEPAILITGSSDCISIESENGYINLNYGSLEDFIKILREVTRNKKNK